MSAGESATPRRPRRDRPATVPLSEFGKEPPPPPRARLTPRQIVIGTLVTAVSLVILMFLLVNLGQQASERWNRGSRCLDARVQC